MSVVDDTQKVLQDFLAPELRAFVVRLDALEKRFDRLDQRIDAQTEKTDRRFEQIEQKIDKRFEESGRRAEARHTMQMMVIQQLADYAEISAMGDAA